MRLAARCLQGSLEKLTPIRLRCHFLLLWRICGLVYICLVLFHIALVPIGTLSLLFRVLDIGRIVPVICFSLRLKRLLGYFILFLARPVLDNLLLGGVIVAGLLQSLQHRLLILLAGLGLLQALTLISLWLAKH